MVETPALISRPRVHVGIATTALVLGVVAIFIPYLGILLGVAAVILGVVALRLKTSHTGPAIAGIAVGGLSIISGILFAVLVSFIFGHASLFSLFPPSDRDKAVTAQVNEKKDYVYNETAKIGPMNVTITKFERNYVPTEDDVAAMKKNTPPYETDPTANKLSSGISLSEDEVEYVYVEGTASLNGSPSLGDFDTNLSQFELNNVEPYVYSNQSSGRSRYSRLESHNPEPMTFLYRIRKDSTTLTLKYVDTIYTSVSPIVGTEGAPRKDLTYTITLK